MITSGEGHIHVPETSDSLESGHAMPILLAAGKQIEILLSKEGSRCDHPFANTSHWPIAGPYCPIGKYLGIRVEDILIYFTIYTHHLLLLVPLLNLTLFAALPPAFAHALGASLLFSLLISPLASFLTSIAALFFACSNALLAF